MKIIYEFDPYEDKDELENVQNSLKNAVLRETLMEYVIFLINRNTEEYLNKDLVVYKLNEILDD